MCQLFLGRDTLILPSLVERGRGWGQKRDETQSAPSLFTLLSLNGLHFSERWLHNLCLNLFVADKYSNLCAYFRELSLHISHTDTDI